MAVFWDGAPCSLVDIKRRFRGAYASNIRVRSSEIKVIIYQTARRNIPVDSHLHTRRRENLKSNSINSHFKYQGLHYFLLK
jgi:hypothetical protein